MSMLLKIRIIGLEELTPATSPTSTDLRCRHWEKAPLHHTISQPSTEKPNVLIDNG